MDNKKDIIQYRTDKRPNNMGLQNAGNNTDSHDKNSPTPATTGKEIENTDSRGDVNSKEIIQYDFSVFLNRKTEKLTTALYMVTSFLSDTEPLKWKLRGCGIDLLSDMTTVRNSSVSEVENIFADYSLAIEEMVSLLEVGVSAKLISEMNFAILKKEYISLKVLIESDKYTENRIGRFVFPQSFFLGDESLIAEANIEGGLNASHIPGGTSDERSAADDKRHIGNNRQNTQPGVSFRPTPNRNNAPASKSFTSGEKKKSRTLRDIKAGKTNRKDNIIKLFKKGEDLMIKDISHKISDCSEKTIQRELIALVAAGVLKKKGERRWSRYSLK